MKNFEERKAEIFRRSEIRLEEQTKRRSRVLLTVTPVLLCLVIVSFSVLPMILQPDHSTGWGAGWFNGETNDFPTTTGGYPGSGSESGVPDTPDTPKTEAPSDTDLGLKLLSARFTAEKQSGKTADEAFARAGTSFALSLFQETVRGEKNADNVMVSPLSVWLALSMTANGADGETRAQMERLLGGDIPLEVLNEYLSGYVRSLPTDAKNKLYIANSIWAHTGRMDVRDDFLQTNANYYGAAVYSAPFDSNTVLGINNWVKKNTGGMIDEMIDRLDPDAIMYLINTLMFEADWSTPYVTRQVRDEAFTTAAGQKKTVSMMYSSEYIYLSDGRATGFIKDFAGSKYSFAALLPNKDVDIYDYIASLSSDGLRETLRDALSVQVTVDMPKFEFEYMANINDILKSLGMTDAFDMERADFSRMGTSSEGNLYIDRVQHKTYITVGELGAKAGAATMVDIAPSASSSPVKVKTVTLDRPFVYMILDNETGLPIFMGMVVDL